MSSLLQRLQAWLRREAYVRAVVAGAVKQAYLDGHAAGMATGQQTGYTVGRAHGQLEGRLALADELEIAFGSDAKNDLTAEDVQRVRVSQVH